MPIAWVMPGCPARAFSGIPDALTFRFPNTLVALGLRLHRSGRPPQRSGGKIHSSKSLPIPLSGSFAVSHASLAENLTLKPVKMTCFSRFYDKKPVCFLSECRCLLGKRARSCCLCRIRVTYIILPVHSFFVL